MKRFKFHKILLLTISSCILLTNSILAQNILSLEDALTITLKENIDIKIKNVKFCLILIYKAEFKLVSKNPLIVCGVKPASKESVSAVSPSN